MNYLRRKTILRKLVLLGSALFLLQLNTFCSGGDDSDDDTLNVLALAMVMNSAYKSPTAYSCGEYTYGEKISSPPGLARTMLYGSPLPYILTSTSDPFTARCAPASISNTTSYGTTTVSFSYNSSNLVTTVTESGVDTVTIQYDGPNGYISSLTRVCDNTSAGTYTTAFTYSGSNLAKEETTILASCKLTSSYGTSYNSSATVESTTYTYDDDVLPTGMVAVTSSGTTTTTLSYTKSNGYVTAIKSTSGSVQSTEEYTYDTSSNLSTAPSTTYTYTDKRVTEKNYQSGSYIYTYTYNDSNNVSAMTLALNTSYMSGSYTYQFNY